MGTRLCHQGRLFNFCFVKCFRKFTVCGVGIFCECVHPTDMYPLTSLGICGLGSTVRLPVESTHKLTATTTTSHTHHFLLQRYWTTQNNFFWGRGRLWMIGTHDRGHQRPIRSNFNFRPKMIKSQFRNFFLCSNFESPSWLLVEWHLVDRRFSLRKIGYSVKLS